MEKNSYFCSIRIKKKLRLKGVLLFFFILTSIFLISIVNFNEMVINFKEEDQILYEENPISSDQGEEIFKLIYGTDAGPSNLDPQNSLKINSFSVIDQVCEGLFTHNLTDPNYSIIPNLATGNGTWFANLTDTWYTVSLRPNVTFHDGTKFNATTVKFTFDRLSYLINNSMAMAGYLYEYYDPDAEVSYPIINKTVIIDEYTIRFELNKPYGPFEALLCFPASYILSPISTPQFALIDTLTGDLVGTGPFVYDHYLPDEEVLFHAFDDYWAGRANITVLKFAIISEYDVAYDKTYSFTTQAEANDGTWDYWNTDIGDHSVATMGTNQYWCWTDTGTTSTATGPPSGISCVYPETSLPTEVGDEYIATLADSERIDASGYNIYVTFNTCMYGDPLGHMYFEYWDGDSWEIKDDWSGNAISTFTAQGPYDFTTSDNSDFKIRFRVVVGGTHYNNDFSFDEVRIYGEAEISDAKDQALLSGEVDIITNSHVSMLSNFSADPDITLNDAGLNTTVQFLSMNNRRINRTFREAISYAINYSYIINELEEHPTERLKSPLPDTLLFANWSFDLATYNITKARETMQSMGFGIGWNTTFPGTSEANWSSASFATFNYSYYFGDTFRENLLILLQDNLDKIGIEVTDAGISYSEFQNILLQNSGYTWDMWELCWLEYHPDYNDPDNFINSLFTNRTTSFNTAFYDGYLAAIESGRDPFNIWDNVQLLMEIALFETNHSIRKPYYDRVQQILVEDDMPWAFGVISHNYDAYRSYIMGFQSNSIGKLSFYGVTQNSSIAPYTIYLSSNQEWQYFRNVNMCTGQGTFSDPYLVKDLVINGEGEERCILIENTDVYFKIENCTLYNSEGAGIRLYNVDNGELLNNTISNNNDLGIVLIYSINNTITRNNISSRNMGGIGLTNSDNNLIRENTVNYNNYSGIGLVRSSYNTIANNSADFNEENGIRLIDSNYNTISTNNFSNNGASGIGLDYCDNTTIIENNVYNNFEVGVNLYTSYYNSVINNTANNNGNYGISLGYSNDNSIRINIVNNNSISGIYLDNSDDNSIRDNTVSNNYDGIKLWYCSNNRILSNLLEYNEGAGIFLDNSDYNEQSRNNATNNFYGISLLNSDGNTISENLIEYNGAGIYLDSCYRNDIWGNNAEDNSYDGIGIWYGANNYLFGNIIDNNFRGISLFSTDRNTFTSNTIRNNDYGIYSDFSECNTVTNNYFYNNGEDIHGDPEYCPYYSPPPINVFAIIAVVVISIVAIIVVVRLITSKQNEVKTKPFREYQRIRPLTVTKKWEDKVAPEPTPPPKAVEELIPPKVAHEPISPPKVEDAIPPKVAPEPIPLPKVVEEIPMEKVTIGKVARVFEGHLKGINAVVFSPDGNYVVSASKDNTIKIWEISSRKLVKTLKGHKKYVTSVALSDDGKYIVSGSNDKTVKIWEFSSGKLIRTLKGHTWFVNAIAVSPDGNYIVSGSFDKEINVWDFNTGDIVRTLEGHKKEVRSVAISPDSEYIASASNDRTLKVWSFETGQIVRTIEAHRKHINSVVFSPDGKHIFSGSNDKTIKEWDIADGKLVRTFEGHTWDVLAVAVSTDANYMVSGSLNKEIKVWDITTGDIVRTLEGHKREVVSVALSPDGKYIVSGSNDKTVKIWKHLE